MHLIAFNVHEHISKSKCKIAATQCPCWEFIYSEIYHSEMSSGGDCHVNLLRMQSVTEYIVQYNEWP